MNLLKEELSEGHEPIFSAQHAKQDPIFDSIVPIIHGLNIPLDHFP